jgi:transposase
LLKDVATIPAKVDLLDTIPGVNQRAAESLVAEIGADMGRFTIASHLASWTGMFPGNSESAGKRRYGKTRKGSKWLGAILAESAAANGRANSTYSALPGTFSRTASPTRTSGSTGSKSAGPKRTFVASPARSRHSVTA